MSLSGVVDCKACDDVGCGDAECDVRCGDIDSDGQYGDWGCDDGGCDAVCAGFDDVGCGETGDVGSLSSGRSLDCLQSNDFTDNRHSKSIKPHMQDCTYLWYKARDDTLTSTSLLALH